ncbi:TIGR04100 family radical SAM protein [Cellulosilyticum sp. I15G10I2]|uniref:TIGR04100 family radical SAM protein n=1 Tax=Cellulosilyticum sp. I15G10I2 TaxID=1892843 RepID=UPI00085C817C|nr:TIGR04100 family radical SAM protein [Cellulosilyticum sp. I15G10I2]
MTILYTIHDSLYVNLTNKCPCACTFCVRQESDGVHGADNLWLNHEPSLKEVLEAFEKHDLDSYESVVFCGYGEPLERLDVVIQVCEYIRAKSKVKIRLNTNGLADLIHGKETAPLLAGKIDEVSISLNAPNQQDYMNLVRPCFGEEAFPSLLKFGAECKKYIGDVTFTVVDLLNREQRSACEKIADEMQIKLRVRPML